ERSTACTWMSAKRSLRAAADRQATAVQVRGGVRRTDERSQQGMAGETHRLAAPSIGRRDPSEQAKRQAEELAHDADLRLTPPRPTSAEAEST
ncbi:MAG: hypothetical protein RMJ88_16195, partial [Thermogemmata sp.]|nr:hypothetical protein [Thermogemmata sp.]